jgi:hypothetical protein
VLPSDALMKTSRIIQFAAAALLFSAGCIALIAHAPFGLSTICFGLPAIILMRRSEAIRPVPRREVWIFMGVLGIFVAAFILACLLIPNSTAERVARHPAFVVPLWVLATCAFFWRCHRDGRSSDA